jgi:hypothetical protein
MFGVGVMTPRALAEKIFFDLRGFKPITDLDLEEVKKLESLLSEALAEAGEEAMRGVLDRRYGSYMDGKKAAFEEAAKIAETMPLTLKEIYGDDGELAVSSYRKGVAKEIRRRAGELK